MIFNSGLLAAVGLFVASSTDACNYIKTTTEDDVTIVARDMQFSIKDFPSKITTYSVGANITGTKRVNMTDGEERTMIPATYGSLSINGFDLGDAIEGMNTEGLQCSGLYLPYYTEYQTVPDDAIEATVVMNLYFCNWVLGLHSSVKEVNSSLADPNLYVVAGPMVSEIFDGNQAQPLHWAITDKSGEGIIVEYVLNGVLTIYRNSVGVMTNSPPYNWQLENLDQFSYMSNLTPQPVNFGGYISAPKGDWGAMQGLPGDLSGPARFVRLTMFLHFAQQPGYLPNAKAGVAMMQTLLNTAEVVNGTAAKTDLDGGIANDLSRWSTMYNLADGILYFRSYYDFTWAQVKMSELDFSEGAETLQLSVYQNDVQPVDLTSKFAAETEAPLVSLVKSEIAGRRLL